MLTNIFRLIICSFIIFVVFWSVGFTKELTFATIIFCSVVLGYGLQMFWDLYRKFQLNVKGR